MSIPISTGSGAASVAAEAVGGLQYQQIQLYGKGAASIASIDPAGAVLVSVMGGINMSGSVIAIASGSVVGIIPGSVITVWQDSSVIARVTGSVIALPTGNQSVSGTVGASVIGWVPIQPSDTSIITRWADSSVIARVTGSIVSINQGSVITVPISSAIVVFQSSSLIAINAGSVVTVPVGSTITVWQNPSIVGTYAEDAAHTSADRGLFVLGVRNDAVASFASANLEYGPFGTDSAGRNVIKPFAPEESRIEGYNSVVSTSVTTLVAAAGAGLRNYITDIILANTGASTTLVTFRSGGGSSILGYGIAPTGGGSNMIGFATPIRTVANETFDFQATTASSILYATVKGFKAP